MSAPLGRIAVTGAHGRLGSALMAALERGGGAGGAGERGEAGPAPVIGGSASAVGLAWGRKDFDLDRPETAEGVLKRDRPDLVIHCAAWTDVDGCAKDPELAQRRNGAATGALARACAEAGVGLLVISTNEVFDGRRTDGQGYREDDPVAPPNPYGASKLAGEEAAKEAWKRAGLADRLWVVRTAWLYGPPAPDFPVKIMIAADRLPPGQPLPVVADEIGSPTYAPDLAQAILNLLAASAGGTFHLVNGGAASRLDWARPVLERFRPGRPVRPISAADFVRASTPPAWAVLDTSRAAGLGVTLRPWTEALETYMTVDLGLDPAGGTGAGSAA